MKKRSEQQSKILEIAVRYKFSYEELYEKLPLWKREIIKNNTGNGIYFSEGKNLTIKNR